ncbi:MAG TPA: polysaccharide deacetylase family protein [Candidatus Saccharimonadales bacterium]|nr:polysaccharide deacetylase family protein [Candidatus Saccharimonadales bacterium]
MSHTKTKTQKIIFLLIAAIIVLSATSIASSALILAKFQKRVLAQTLPQTQATTSATLSAATTSTQEPSPYPSASPSPSPVVLSGYCINIPILMYHHIQPMSEAGPKGQGGLTVDNGTFDSQMAYIKSKGYNTITMLDVATALKNHTGLGKSIVVTLDDGYKDQFRYAHPIAQKYGIKLNLFISTGLLGDGGDYMNWGDLKQMVATGDVAYDHTWSHAAVAAAPPDKMSFEILTAKKQLEDNLGGLQNIFAYPYGNPSDAGARFLQANGFVAAASTIQGTTQCDSFIMALHRTRVGGLSLSAYGI